ncbi:DUF4055 domain-containing protein [Leptothoe sp. PORK10 BA2]|uniref:DUF4055 domain-containing protein n=1 Tax=Leptothoe sp. PORK10 BA2 TaxID=3110254 RepID=UPI002B21AA63|nr:DUF4055 domain-containing protein [Leptothoe sp. PORK10 BA2]MEA5465271.1 DUF4055 domain-containing protein [Leptothoe sp. PORK10 BA2]
MVLIDYECVAYRRQSPHWCLIEDVYRGDTAWVDFQADGKAKATALARRYLPQMPGESDSDYEARLLQSHFSDKFAQAVRDFVGMIFNNGVKLVDVPDVMRAQWAALDGDAMDGDRLCALLGMRGLRLGHTFCFIDYPELDQSLVSLADTGAAGRQPFWSSVSPLQVINWRYRMVGNRKVLAWAVLRSQVVEADGDYGEQECTYYRLLTPGRFDTYQVVKGRDGKPQQVHLPKQSGVMGRRIRGSFVPFDSVPLVCLYGGDRTGFFESNPTLLSMAKLNVSHYQVRSDHRQKMHYCCFPSPVRVGGDGSDLALGPRSVVDVPVGGGFAWAEPNANSLSASRQEVKDIEDELNFLGADFLVKPSDRQAAMTSVIQATTIESELYLFASDFALGITECLNWHARYLGLPSGGRAELDTQFFRDLSADPQLLQVLLQMREREDISRDELRAVAQRKHLLPEENN